jgi:hypothetical protein
MIDKPLSLPELRREGLQALIDRLGAIDAVRFIQLFDPGVGDFTAERRLWTDAPGVEEAARQVIERDEQQRRTA